MQIFNDNTYELTYQGEATRLLFSDVLARQKDLLTISNNRVYLILVQIG
jgi:hypothetical protein